MSTKQSTRKNQKAKSWREKEKRNTIIYVVLQKVFWRSLGPCVSKHSLTAQWWMKRENCANSKRLSLMVFELFFKIYFEFLIFQGRNDDQVCGKNNITYHSWCHLMKDSCNTGFFIDIKNAGRCTSWYILFMLFDGGTAHIGNGSFNWFPRQLMNALWLMIKFLCFLLYSAAWKIFNQP